MKPAIESSRAIMAAGMHPQQGRRMMRCRMNASMSENTRKDIQTLREWIDRCPKGRMVFFGGAGVSTESGIPDFRSPTGLYGSPRAKTYEYSPEFMCSRTFFDGHTAEFYDFYTDRMLYLEAQPNRAHRKLAQLEADGILGAVVTQNIDGLHQAAGSMKVFELHGGVLRNFCRKCNRFYDVHQMMAARDADPEGIPHCECGGVIKPDVVLYEEPLDESVMEGAIRAIASADLLLIAGTSLAVYPAAGLIDFFHGSHLAIVNMSPTDRDRSADICIAASIGDVLDY